MFKIAVCDDESLFAENLKELISNYMTEKDLVCEIDTYISGKKLLEQGVKVTQYEIIFLDINMEEIDGIKAAETIRELSRDVFIVFVTAYVDYSLEGYRLDVIRYLLKGNANFKDTVNECIDAIMEKKNYSVIKKVFNFKEGRKEIILDRLLYIESNLHKLMFYVMDNDGEPYIMSEKLGTLEDELAGNNFIRIHKSYLVNAKYIESITRYKVKLKLPDGVELAIPKARYTFVKKQFIAYQGEV